MAMSVSLSNLAFQIHHRKMMQISNLGPVFIRWRPKGTLRIFRNHRRGGRARVRRLWNEPAPGPRPWTPLLWFLVILRLPLGLQHMNMGPKLLIWNTSPWWF